VDWDDTDQVLMRAAVALFGLVVLSMVFGSTKSRYRQTQTRWLHFWGRAYDRFMGWAAG
jgi:hypothetical protein